MDAFPTCEQYNVIAHAWIDAAEDGDQEYSEDPAVQADLLAAAIPLGLATRGVDDVICDAVYMNVLSQAVTLWARDAGIPRAEAYMRLRRMVDEMTTAL